MGRKDYRQALRRTGLLAVLARYDPHLAGTLPLGLDLPSSDVDLLCHAPDRVLFSAVLWGACHQWPDFSLRQWVSGDQPVTATFSAFGWAFEIFASPQPVREQPGWRHYQVEQRLLALGGPELRASVMRHRHAGAKTEPAFAMALGLTGDAPGGAYATLLELERATDRRLREILEAAGFAAG